MKHRWIGRPRDARRWYDEKRRHAPYYVAVGGTTIVVGLLVMGRLWDGLDPATRWMPVVMVLVVGGTVLAFGPVLYYLSDKHSIYLHFPMRKGLRVDLKSTSAALEGYLSARKLMWRKLRPWTDQDVVMEMDSGLRLRIIASAVDGAGQPNDIMLNIFRISPWNVDEAEALQRIMDEWPLLDGLRDGVDEELAKLDESMGF